MPHVDDGTLHAFLDGALRAEEREAARRVEAHLEACADCRARLDDAAALRDRASGVLAALDAGLAGQATADEHTADDAFRPDFQDVLARAGAGTGEPGGPADEGIRRQYRWTRGLAWAATIVVALGTGYLARDLAGPTGMGPATAVRETGPVDARDAAATGESADDAAAPVERSAASDPAGTRDREPAAPEGGSAMANQTEPVAGAAEGRAAAGASTPRTAETERAPDLMTTAQAPGPRPEAPGDQAREPREEAVASDIDDAAPAWQPATLDEAEAVAGAILVLPGARLAAAEVAGREARTLQELPGGVEVEVVQAAGDSLVAPERRALAADRALGAELGAARAEAPVDAASRLVGLDLDSVSVAVEEPVTVVVARDGLTLRLTGRLPEDVLRALAATASPRER